MKQGLVVVCTVLVLAGCSFGGKPRETARPIDSGDAGEYLLVQGGGDPGTMRYRLVQGERWKFEHRLLDGSWEDASCRGDCQLRDTSADQAARFMRGKVPGGRFASCLHNSAYAFCRVAGSRGPRSYAFVSLSTGTPIPFDLERVDEGADSPAS